MHSKCALERLYLRSGVLMLCLQLPDPTANPTVSDHAILAFAWHNNLPLLDGILGQLKLGFWDAPCKFQSLMRGWPQYEIQRTLDAFL
jgi:hypothetical protein